MDNRIQLLLVEDSPSDVRLTQEALKRSDLQYDLQVANDGVAAMEYLEEHKKKRGALPDMILLDLNMPRKNGHEVLAEIKDDPVLKKIPVILLTVSQRDEDVLEALKLKMNYYLSKPVTSHKLSVLVRAIHELNAEQGFPVTQHHLSDEDTQVRIVLASNPHTAPTVLERLARETNERVRCRVAENPQTPLPVLKNLAADQSPEVRLSVAENENTPPAVLESLAKDGHEDVRLGIASNPRTPTQILEGLTSDDNLYVVDRAMKTLNDIGH